MPSTGPGPLRAGDATQVGVSPSSVTFTSANWNSAATVTVTPVDDSKGESATTYTLSHTASSSDTAYNADPFVPSATVAVTVYDDDGSAIVLPTADVGVDEFCCWVDI